MSVHEIDNLIVHAVRPQSAGPDRPRRAVLEVVPHQLAADAAKGFVNRGDLREDVGAVSIFLHHFLKTANLPLDAAQAVQVSRFHFRIDTDRFGALHIRAHLISSGQARRARRSRKLFVTTLTELKAIAALAMIGLSINPVTGYRTPAAIGIPITL
jgi:hypothetical protein